MPREIKEKDIQKSILDYLRLRRIFCWKAVSVGIYKQATKQYIPIGMKGVSDIIGILPDGKFLAIEVKRPDKYPTPSQEEFLNKIEIFGGVAFVANSIEDVKRELNLK